MSPEKDEEENFQTDESDIFTEGAFLLHKERQVR